MNRKLATRKTYNNQIALDIIKQGTDKEKAELAIALGFDSLDFTFAHRMCIVILEEKSEMIRTNAMIGLSHIARRFKRLDKGIALPYILNEINHNVSGKELILDAIMHINIYLDWNIPIE